MIGVTVGSPFPGGYQPKSRAAFDPVWATTCVAGTFLAVATASATNRT